MKPSRASAAIAFFVSGLAGCELIATVDHDLIVQQGGSGVGGQAAGGSPVEGGGGSVLCESADMCPAPPACQTAICEDGGCSTIDADAGTTCDLADVGDGVCDGRGSCVGDGLPNGDACAADGECGSGHCATVGDGSQLCCDTACDGACESCAMADTGSADGACSAVTDGTDAKDACATSECQTGSCEAGVCGNEPSTTDCGAGPACATDDLKPQDKCDGNGACASPANVDCMAYSCDSSQTPDACFTACAAHTECAAANYCVGVMGSGGPGANSTCQPKKATGVACTKDVECISGTCAAAVCL